MVGSERLNRRGRQRPARLLVASGGCGLAVGASEVRAALVRATAQHGSAVTIGDAGCTGMCHESVQVTLQRIDRPDITWNRVDPGQATALVEIAVGRRPAASLPSAFAWEDWPVDGLLGLPQMPFLATQHRFLLQHAGRIDPIDA